MVHRYREVCFGLLFGLAAVVIDIAMHAGMQDRSFTEELIHPEMGMLFYRILFLAFGVALGFLLWKTNKRERESRNLAEALEKLGREIAAPSIIIHTQAQLLLTREHPALLQRRNRQSARSTSNQNGSSHLPIDRRLA